MRSSPLVLALLFGGLLAGGASAGLIVENGPATTNSFRIGGPNTQIEAVIWAQNATTSRSISALIGSVDGSSRTVDAYLTYNSIFNIIATTTVTVGAFADPSAFTPVEIFSRLSLAAGAYGLVLFNTDTTGDVNVRWSVGASTTNTANGEFFYGAFSNGGNANPSNPVGSYFTSSEFPLGFSVRGDVVVPEPSTVVSALGSILAVGAFARFRRKAN